MEKFTIIIDLPIETIRAGYKNYFGDAKRPKKKDLSAWIGNLAEADILDCSSHKKEDSEEESD